tara:strand:+ start:470 stop:3088 length:2619 start_codon:yes stop_codon:yes gene_type:complete
MRVWPHALLTCWLLGSTRAQPTERRVIDFYGRGGRLYANGIEFKMKGVNWFGQESKLRVPFGLWERPLGDLLDFVAENGFNTLRFFFSLQNVDENLPTPRNFDVEDSPELVGTDHLGMVAAIAEQAARRGILLVLVNHQIRNGYPDDWPGEWDGTWFDPQYTKEKVLQIWSTLAEKFCTDEHWNIIGVDIMNEPFDLGWDEWADAAAWIGNHVLRQCKRWLVFVEGTGNEPPAEPGMEWGENMLGVRHKRVRLSNDSKLVYSPHVYGPGLFQANNIREPDYMRDDEFPYSCRDVWERHFGYVPDFTRRPMVIGEMGGNYRGRDRQWQQEFIRYAIEKGFGLLYFALNPNTHDTGGILLDDWTTPDKEKLKMLSAVPATSVASLVRLPVPSPTLPPPYIAPVVPDCEWHGRSDIAPRTCSDIGSQMACELFWTSAVSPPVVCSWVLSHGKQTCDGHEADPCPQPPSPPAPPPSPPPPPGIPPPPQLPFLTIPVGNVTHISDDTAIVGGGGRVAPPQSVSYRSRLMRLTIGGFLLAGLVVFSREAIGRLHRRYRRKGFRAVAMEIATPMGSQFTTASKRYGLGRVPGACGRVWQALLDAINAERQASVEDADDGDGDGDVIAFTIDDDDEAPKEPELPVDLVQAVVEPEAPAEPEIAETPTIEKSCNSRGVSASSDKPHPGARNGGSDAPALMGEAEALDGPVEAEQEPEGDAQPEEDNAEPQLTVLVTLPADSPVDTEAGSSDEDAEVSNTIDTLIVLVDEIDNVPGLRAAIKESFELSETSRSHAMDEFDIWYRSPQGRRAMMTAATNVNHVLQARRVWLTPNSLSRPRPARRPASSAQPFRPKYGSPFDAQKQEGQGSTSSTVKWMSSSLD